MRNKILTILLDALLLAGVVSGGFYEISITANLTVVVVAFITVGRFILILGYLFDQIDEPSMARRLSTPGWRMYRIVITVVLAVLMTMVGWIGLSMFYTTAMIIYLASIKTAKDMVKNNKQEVKDETV